MKTKLGGFEQFLAAQHVVDDVATSLYLIARQNQQLILPP